MTNISVLFFDLVRRSGKDYDFEHSVDNADTLSLLR